MIYHVTVSIPANTSALFPANNVLTLPPGLLVQEFLTFPDGCSGLVGARVVVRERVIWPSNPDEWFVNNNYTYAFEDPLELPKDSEVFRLEGYNSDQVYPHTLYLALVEKRAGEVSLLDVLGSLPVLANLGS